MALDQKPTGGVVLGGGIAGLAFAAAMSRHGQSVTVLEAASTLRAHGSGLVLGPTAMLALRRLGLREQIIATGQILNHGRFSDLSMRPLTQDVFGYFGDRSGEPFVGVERSTLVRMLAKAAPDCRTNAQYLSVEDDGSGLMIELEDGDRLHAPSAVLADGIRSTGRDDIGVTKVRDAG